MWVEQARQYVIAMPQPVLAHPQMAMSLSDRVELNHLGVGGVRWWRRTLFQSCILDDGVCVVDWVRLFSSFPFCFFRRDS